VIAASRYDRVEENMIEFQSTNVQFRWIQYNTTGSPAWAIDDIIIDCNDYFQRISFEEEPE